MKKKKADPTPLPAFTMLTSRYFKPKCLEAPITGASKLFVHTSSDTELMKSMMSSYDRLLLVKALMSSSV